jgi:hypothetical protein
MTSEAAGIRRPDAGVLMKAGGNKHIPSAPHLGCRLAAVETASPPPIADAHMPNRAQNAKQPAFSAIAAPT